MLVKINGKGKREMTGCFKLVRPPQLFQISSSIEVSAAPCHVNVSMVSESFKKGPFEAQMEEQIMV